MTIRHKLAAIAFLAAIVAHLLVFGSTWTSPVNHPPQPVTYRTDPFSYVRLQEELRSLGIEHVPESVPEFDTIPEPVTVEDIPQIPAEGVETSPPPQPVTYAASPPEPVEPPAPRPEPQPAPVPQPTRPSDLCRLVSRYDWPQQTAYAVCYGESMGKTDLTNNRDYHPSAQCRGSFGLFQIGCLWIGHLRGIDSRDDLFDPDKNVAAAYDLWLKSGKSFRHWSAYKYRSPLFVKGLERY